MDNKTINDIAEKLEDIKNDTITERRHSNEPHKLPIDELIKRLKEEKKSGSKYVECYGTIITDRFNSVIMTNEPQM